MSLLGPTSQIIGPQLNLGLSVVASSPAAGDVLTQSPTCLTLTFDRPVDPFSVWFDVVLSSAGGSDINLFPGDLDPTGTVMTIPINQTLAPGHYQISFSNDSMLMGQDGSPLAVQGPDHPLGDFWVVSSGPSLSNAVLLPTPTSTPVATSGALDFTTNPFAVAMYQFHLDGAPGTLWRVGLEVRAQRDGSPLDAALTLFDDQGRPIDTADYGRRDAPNDPYLFAGLGPGTYYVGVSGRLNLPGAPGGYDPVTGSPGSIVQTQPGGAFQLVEVADKVSGPTTVMGFRLDRLDPQNSIPTGFTLQFSGALRFGDQAATASGLLASLDQGVEVVDQDGHVWPVLASGYDEANARISYLFQSHLPPGRYTVRLPAAGGLVDLAGLSPVARGKAPGVLATFTIGVGQSAPNPTNLGALLPNDLVGGKQLLNTLAPGAEVVYRLVITQRGLYSIETNAGSQVVLSLTKQGSAGQGQSVIDLQSGLAQLQPGVYLLHVANASASLVTTTTRISLTSLPEDLVWSGVGQGSALNLTLITPEPWVDPPQPPSPSPSEPGTPGLPGGTPTTPLGPVNGVPLGPFTQPTLSTPGSGASGPVVVTTNGGALSAVGSIEVGGADWLLVPFGGQFVGRPQLQADHVAAVGPAASPDSPALALNGNQLLSGLDSGLALGPGQLPTGPRIPRGWASPVPEEIVSEPGPVAPTNGALTQRETPTESGPTTPVEPDANWLNRIRREIAAWFEAEDQASPAPDAAEEGSPVLLSQEIAANPDDPMQEPPQDRIDTAGFMSPFGVGLVAYLTLRQFRHQRRSNRRSRLNVSQVLWPNRPHRRFGSSAK